jgi:hypothetical protein
VLYLLSKVIDDAGCNRPKFTSQGLCCRRRLKSVVKTIVVALLLKNILSNIVRQHLEQSVLVTHNHNLVQG